MSQILKATGLQRVPALRQHLTCQGRGGGRRGKHLQINMRSRVSIHCANVLAQENTTEIYLSPTKEFLK